VNKVKMKGEPQPENVDSKLKEIVPLMLGNDDLEEEKTKPRSAQWCLKFSNWVSEVQKDGLCVAGGIPECCDCLWAAWNITIEGHPASDMPKPLNLTENAEKRKDLVRCPHGSLWLRRGVYSRNSKGERIQEWIQIHVDINCECKFHPDRLAELLRRGWNFAVGVIMQ
jgi:hypothetical protein